ncbi:MULTISPECIES: nicotinamide riboside transporter PnuC [Francisella]|uniref:Nicotinamide riboside transporter PnuC n=2 Tax=Francisella TaxID=262 RepID=A0AAJ4NP16_9GAMM|nr:MULTISPECIES: nicotinamide riboside transporter PnuC [Francisella]QEO57821.1 nicotinamide mononucleotide transporter [Francisella marina]QEO59953.1 nicotinamide mononucleotide transporter [Francisella marina]QWU99245.1 nicotinamide riboside transporter PnuC [Francisella salimarina]
MIHLLDFCTMIINLLCTFLLAGLYVIGWPVGIVGLIMSAGLFSISGLYADAILQIILLFSFGYGWYSWQPNFSHKKVVVHRLKIIGWLKVLVSIGVFGLVVSQLLINYTDSTTPYMDGFTSVASLVCVFLASRKIIDNWMIWMVVDSTYVLLYMYKDLAFAAITTFIYLIVAIYGYIHWKKLMYI